MKILGTHHVALKTANFAAMRTFYETTLGLPLLGGFPGINTVFLAVGTTTLELIEAAPARGGWRKTLDLLRGKVQRRLGRGWHHLALEVSDIEEAFTSLAERGVRFHVTPRSYPVAMPLARLAFFKDPDGNEIELYQPLGERYPHL